MPEDHETRVERDSGDTKIIIERPRKRGEFGWGMLFGALLIAAVVIGFGYSQGSFQQAGREADQATAQVEQQTQSAMDEAAESVDQAANETSETATN